MKPISEALKLTSIEEIDEELIYREEHFYDYVPDDKEEKERYQAALHFEHDLLLQRKRELQSKYTRPAEEYAETNEYTDFLHDEEDENYGPFEMPEEQRD